MDAPEERIVKSPIGHPTTGQRRILWTALTALAVLALVGVAGAVFFGFVALLAWCYPILLPIGLAVIIALVLEPAVGYVQKKRRMKRETAALSVCVIAVGAVVLFWAFLSRPVIDSTAQFFQKLPDYFNAGFDKLERTMNGAPPKVSLDLHPAAAPAAPPTPGATNHFTISPAPLKEKLDSSQVLPDTGIAERPPSVMQTWVKANLPSIEQSLQRNLANLVYSALGPVGQAFGFLLGFGFVPIYVYYFLADEERITRHWHEYVPLRRSPLRDEVVSVLAEISASLVSYFRGQIIVAACNGVLTFLGLWIVVRIGFSNSLVLGILTGTLSIVPFLGVVCSIVPSLLLGFLSAQDNSTQQWLKPVLVLVVFAVVQMSESMFVTPRVQSHSTGLHPLTIILGILFWSMLLPGLLGPIVAVPLTCAMVVLLRRYVWLERTKSRQVIAEKEAGTSGVSA